ncbi:MAG: hypothetical protein ABI443_05995 [Chthoniobacterales bacterium]
MTQPLRIAIVHYHLRAGGVTRVIEQASTALIASGCEVAVFAGEVPADFSLSPEVRLQILPGLNYSSEYSEEMVARLETDLDAACIKAFGRMPDVWHFHNHSLGKNLNLPHIVKYWSEKGRAMVLQIHDFAENGRPENYQRLLQIAAQGDTTRLAEILYPVAPGIHYAVLNPRDLEILRAAGAGESVSILSNPVEWDESRVHSRGLLKERFTLYPCRPIRRKNIGEALLWTFFFEEGERLVIPVAPHLEADRKAYALWCECAAQLRLPVEFEAIPRLAPNLETLVASAHRILTTSIMEGFGMTFLEPFLAGKPLIGRNLPEITENFSSDGIGLQHLYTSLPIPVEWVGHKRLQQSFKSAILRLKKAYGIKIPESSIEKTESLFINSDTVDFGHLSEDIQREVLMLICVNPEMKKQILTSLLAVPSTPQLSRDAIREYYSASRYAKNAIRLYKEILSATGTASGYLNAQSILETNVSQSLPLLLRITG